MLRKLIVGLLLTSLLAPAALDAAQQREKRRGGGKKPKPGQQQQQQPAKPGSENPQQGQGNPPPAPEPPPAAIGTVDRKLLEYRTSEARSAINGVAGQADSNAYVAAALGRVLEQEKSYGEAVTRLRKATELAPSDPAPWVHLGAVYARQNQKGEADAAFRKATEVAQGRSDGDSLYYLGVAQQQLGQYDQAVQTLERARSGRESLASYQIGVTRAYQENWTAAVEQLDRAISADSGLALAYYYRGLANEKLGRKDKLINDMERFVDLAPSSPEADRARAILRAARR
ncbi:MAG TPA: tetratricopeptide repeat protein [Thermoanaerobaculia bacterium]|nr:tetratricopeptide repeat protein [Thermoanaerobaculia bacterium]